MFFTAGSLILAIILANIISPSFLPKDGFFSIDSEVPGWEKIFSVDWMEKFYLRGLNCPRAEVDLSSPAGILPPPRSTSTVPEISARAGVVVDMHSQRALWAQSQSKPLPIASITKLVTALVFLDTNPDWEAYYQITKEDRREGGKIYLFLGERVKIKDLFKTSLVASANTATVALVHSTGLEEEEFVRKMNQKTESLGLPKTNFEDVTGLNSENISTAWEISKIAKTALEKDRIREALSVPEYEFKTQGGREKRIKSTDELLESFSVENINFLGGKTGYQEEAGYCFVGGFKRGEDYLISVILGAESKKERFSLTEKLIKWSYKGHKW